MGSLTEPLCRATVRSVAGHVGVWASRGDTPLIFPCKNVIAANDKIYHLQQQQTSFAR